MIHPTSVKIGGGVEVTGVNRGMDAVISGGGSTMSRAHVYRTPCAEPNPLPARLNKKAPAGSVPDKTCLATNMNATFAQDFAPAEPTPAAWLYFLLLKR